MYKLSVKGEGKLEGKLSVQGSKNAVLPILSACLLCRGECIIHNCPCLSDVYKCIEILKSLGCCVKFSNGTITVNSMYANSFIIPCDLVKSIRSSFIFMGALLGTFNKAQICLPGGCNIGLRPVDLHIDAFKKLGCTVDADDGINFYAEKIKNNPCAVVLKFPSVGATENIMLFASTLDGITQIINPAKEPEIIDLQRFLNKMGANITGAGTSVITIYGTKNLKGCEYTVMPDRIEQATLMSAVGSAGGFLELEGCCNLCIKSYIEFLQKLGVVINCPSDNKCIIRSKGSLMPYGGNINLTTMPYPGFATDCQSMAMSMLAMSKGTGIIRENIFENRFQTSDELIKMGADIKICENTAYINGKGKLNGNNVTAHDLRCGASLIVAGLGAEGETNIDKAFYILRGYENLDGKLNSIGALIERDDNCDKNQSKNEG